MSLNAEHGNSLRLTDLVDVEQRLFDPLSQQALALDCSALTEQPRQTHGLVAPCTDKSLSRTHQHELAQCSPRKPQKASIRSPTGKAACSQEPSCTLVYVPSSGAGKRLRARTAAASSFMYWERSYGVSEYWLKLESSPKSCK